jgi:stress response protein YsnF
LQPTLVTVTPGDVAFELLGGDRLSTPPDPSAPIPIVEERVHVTKRAAETDHVRVRTVVEESPVVLEEIVERGAVEVLRVATERAVSSAPPPRQEGDTLIISVVEERVILEKRLFVVEEVHLRRTSTHETVSLPTTVRKMRALIERPTAIGNEE